MYLSRINNANAESARVQEIKWNKLLIMRFIWRGVTKHK